MQLTYERIITAAVQLIEREGADAFSMRRIASDLGAGVMSLYNYVPSRAAVLDGIAERILSDIDFSTEPGASWEEQVRAQARAFRQIGRTYPRCTMVVVSRPVDSAASLRPIEHALATLSQAGFPPRTRSGWCAHSWRSSSARWSVRWACPPASSHSGR